MAEVWVLLVLGIGDLGGRFMKNWERGLVGRRSAFMGRINYLLGRNDSNIV